MTDLHAAIMNLPAAKVQGEWGDYAEGYRIGHRDAREAAAKLAEASGAEVTVKYSLTWKGEPLEAHNGLGSYADLDKAKRQRLKMLEGMGDDDVTIYRVETRVSEVIP